MLLDEAKVGTDRTSSLVRREYPLQKTLGILSLIYNQVSTKRYPFVSITVCVYNVLIIIELLPSMKTDFLETAHILKINDILMTCVLAIKINLLLISES